MVFLARTFRLGPALTQADRCHPGEFWWVCTAGIFVGKDPLELGLNKLAICDVVPCQSLGM